MTKVNHTSIHINTHQYGILIRLPILPIMSDLEKKIKRLIFGVLCPIARSQTSYTTHSFQSPANLGYIGIVPLLVNCGQVLSKFEQVSAPTFATIGGAV